MKVYIIRHGQAPSNVTSCYNREDENLTDIGIQQAEELRDKIKSLKFDLVISSPLPRAAQTAKIVTSNSDKIVYDDRLKERSCGDLVGKPVTVTNRDEYWNYNTKIQYGTAEKVPEFFKRVHGFLDELKTKNYKSVLVVAHSGVSKAFSAYFEGIGDGMFLHRGLKNCEIKEYNL